VVISFALNCQKLAHKQLEAARSATNSPGNGEVEQSDYGTLGSTTRAASSEGTDLERQDRGRGEERDALISPGSLPLGTQPLLLHQAPRSPNSNGALQFYAQPYPTSPSPRKTPRFSVLPRRWSVTSPGATSIPEEAIHPDTPNVSVSFVDTSEQVAPKITSPGVREVSWEDQQAGKPPSASQDYLNFGGESRFESKGNETDYLKSKLW